MKQDLNLGWTSYDFKGAPMPSEDICKAACNANSECDFYTFIIEVMFGYCLCGEYKVPDYPVNLIVIASVSEVTLKYKKGETKDIFH